MAAVHMPTGMWRRRGSELGRTERPAKPMRGRRQPHRAAADRCPIGEMAAADDWGCRPPPCQSGGEPQWERLRHAVGARRQDGERRSRWPSRQADGMISGAGGRLATRHRITDGAAAGAVIGVMAWALALVPASCAQATVLNPRAIHSDILHNGLRLIVCEDPDASVVSVAVVIKAGSADDPGSRLGTAHLLEHVLWTGGGEDDPRLRIERVGGVANAGTLRDFTRFHATVPAEHFELAVRALGDAVLRDVFADAAVRREQRVIRQEGAGVREDPRALLSDLAFAALYGREHPYGHPIDGDEADLHAIDAARLSLFHSTWYVPNNMTVVVSGGTSFAPARAAVGAVFGGLLPAAIPAHQCALPPRPAGEPRSIVEIPGRDAYVMAAFAGPSASEPGAVCASDLLATVLAHGPTGRLNRELRENDELAQAVGVEFLTQRGQALFGVWAVCEWQKLPAVEEAIRGELARVAAEPIPGPEFAAAKRLLSAGYAFANETPADRASTLGFYDAIDAYRAASYYLPRVRALTRADVMRVAARYDVEPVWVVLRPENEQP